MRNITATGNLFGEAITVKQISKIKAAKLFSEGKEIYLQSSNMNPFGRWQSLCPIKLDLEKLKSEIEHNNYCINIYSEEVNECNNSPEQWRKNLLQDYSEKLKSHQSKIINAGSQFKSIVNEYSFYNCDNERGKYVTFYSKY
jgi:hypothetical protein